jgi:hypothetical protein
MLHLYVELVCVCCITYVVRGRYAVCSPSRNSFMSGRRPDTTLTYNFKDDFRHVPAGRTAGAPPGTAWLTYPEYFKVHGYNTTGCGKTFHSGHPKNFDQPYSWTEGVSYMGYNQGLCEYTHQSVQSYRLCWPDWHCISIATLSAANSCLTGWLTGRPAGRLPVYLPDASYR